MSNEEDKLAGARREDVSWTEVDRHMWEEEKLKPFHFNDFELNEIHDRINGLKPNVCSISCLVVQTIEYSLSLSPRLTISILGVNFSFSIENDTFIGPRILFFSFPSIFIWLDRMMSIRRMKNFLLRSSDDLAAIDTFLLYCTSSNWWSAAMTSQSFSYENFLRLLKIPAMISAIITLLPFDTSTPWSIYTGHKGLSYGEKKNYSTLSSQHLHFPTNGKSNSHHDFHS